MSLSSIQPSPQILLTSAGRAWNVLSADFIHIPRGRVHVPGGEMHRLGMHFGPPVNADCQCGGRRMRRVQKPGDIDIIPAGVDGSWEDDADCRILRLSFSRSLLDRVAADLGRHGDRVELMPQLQLRDTRLEAIGWAIKADLEADTPSDPLYIDLLANALAVRLIETATGGPQRPEGRSEPKLSARQLRVLTEFIETHLDKRLHLADLAAVAGLSATRLKTLFRNSTGLPVHQYVIRRRVEHARALMTTTMMPASEIAVAAGFAHQSHMASTMRRLLGETPGEIMRRAAEI
ncbi:helix-turn-helix transcriptional regulator [Ensifer sp. ENS10]|uniref:helix-turn-helix transcriptional regulator n=1 Tax=unclassified Ensifer TaxID=2633371 RepID=UPI00070F57BE|nr:MULTISPECIES: AraC family transcriptional regulator [unclassified Ensifer]KRD53228.1 AraC family transcriptional regulator [Ensifer sp. Root278]MBD9507048.1 helix-turn-helix transcriptional regulator [Ensifer sp. ENS10]MBV7517281.1 AraC family transcriptional regulator [Ensifer sp. ENS12]